jgi:hypothetical protein
MVVLLPMQRNKAAERQADELCVAAKDILVFLGDEE